MGSSSSKFRKHLQNGDEYAALQLFNSSSDLRKDLDPNSSYGDTYSHDTPMHYAARHAMKSLLRIFLYEHGGNPNKKNARNETSLHNVCMVPASNMAAALQRRRECLMLILQWRGATLKDGEVEKVDLGAQDEKDNTALHYAAASGLKRCVELLVSKGAPLFKENSQKQTPCDSAEINNHNTIALYLESKMVFSNEDDDEEDTDLLGVDTEELYSGLRAQDLQEAKDQLLVETADMLRIPLFTAEALLRNHEWSREMLLESWMDDPVACCDKCGVVPPTTLYTGRTEDTDHDLTSPTHTSPPQDETICDICAGFIPTSDEPVPMACDHQFCRFCWERYLTGKIKDGDAHNITCPGYDCSKLVPVEIIETLVSRDMARRYLQFDIKAFVESNPHIKWCPYPGCGRAVKLPDSDNPLSPTFRDPNQLNAANDFSHAVDCGNGHTFCWECLGEAHEPASCDHWKQWHTKIADVKPEELSGTEEETEMAANCLWLITNSKTCPNCKSPIQKNEGCNHMKCSKCKHDFCWVCLEAWKKHSSATGGYFRCNRYEVVRTVESQTDTVKSDAEARNKRMQELNKFVHYYTRFKNHENSHKLEQPLLSTAKEKMMVLARAVTDQDSAMEETRFVEDAVQQLLKARRVLKCCYVYGYYLEETGYKKPIFEFMQTELEECTESLSEMIARPYLRTPRHKIIQTASLVQRKRHEFVTAIAKGLVPPDNSPNQRRKRNKYSIDLDEDLKKALLASVQDDMTPQTSWVKDPRGRHTNLSAVFDWPEESDDSDTEPATTCTATNPNQPCSAVPEEICNSVCIRPNCKRPRAQNPRTGEIHDHCSIRCFRMDQAAPADDSIPVSPSEYFDYQIELLRALEMSRIEFQREMGSLQPGTGDRSPRSPNFADQRVEYADPALLQQHLQQQAQQQQQQQEPLVLQAPPKGRVPPRGWGWTVAGNGGQNSGSESDVELQRAIQLSASSFHGTDEERDLRIAIELSLQETAAQEGPEPGTSHVPLPSHVPMTEPSAEEYTRVRSKSPETFEEPPPQLGACGGASFPEGTVMKTSRSHEWVTVSNQGRPMRPQELEGSNQIRPSRSHEWDHSVKQTVAPQHVAPMQDHQDPMKMANTFGLIKDISVNNILASDTDKTKDFDKKDFSQMYVKKHPAAMHDMETVFEPRPPYPSNQELIQSGRRLHLTPPPAATTCYQSACQDVWIEQSQLKQQQQQQSDQMYTTQYCRSPNSRSPRQSIAIPRSPRTENHTTSRIPSRECAPTRSPREPYSRSPREIYNRSPRDSLCRSPRGVSSRNPSDASRSPRDPNSRSPREFYSRSPQDLPRPQPVFTFEPYATAGSVPDLLSSCPARCLAASNSHMAPPVARDRVTHSCTDVAYHPVSSTYDDDDPGPRLDAVLRSLQKLSTRLGENDEFLSSLSSDLNQDPHQEQLTQPPPPPPQPQPLQQQQQQQQQQQHHSNLSSSHHRNSISWPQGNQSQGPSVMSNDANFSSGQGVHHGGALDESTARHGGIIDLSQPAPAPGNNGVAQEDGENAVFV